MKKYFNRFDMFGSGSSGSTESSDGTSREEPRAHEASPKRAIERVIERVTAGEKLSKTEVAMETGLCPEEFVVHLLEHRDDSIQQKNLVETLGWSKSSVSRLLNALEDDGVVERIQIGRTKQVFLSDERR